MELAHIAGPARPSSPDTRSNRHAGPLLAFLRDGALVAAAVLTFAATAVVRFGWSAMTASGTDIGGLLGFVAVYLAGAFIFATLWLAVSAVWRPRSGHSRHWETGFLVSVPLMIAAILLVPPIWD